MILGNILGIKAAFSIQMLVIDESIALITTICW